MDRRFALGVWWTSNGTALVVWSTLALAGTAAAAAALGPAVLGLAIPAAGGVLWYLMAPLRTWLRPAARCPCGRPLVEHYERQVARCLPCFVSGA